MFTNVTNYNLTKNMHFNHPQISVGRCSHYKYCWLSSTRSRTVTNFLCVHMNQKPIYRMNTRDHNIGL